MSKDKSYARCKACDRGFYPRWRKDRKEFEELCWECSSIAIRTAACDPVLYVKAEDGFRHPDSWNFGEGSDQSDRRFVEGWRADKLGGAKDSELMEDEYHMYGEGAMGELAYFDSYEE